MATRLLRIVLALLPLAAGLFLLRLMPQVAQAPAVELPGRIAYFDPLLLAGLLVLPLGTARPRATLGQTLRLVLGTAGAMLTLAARLPILQLLLLYGISLLLFDGLGPRWFVALGSLAVANALPLLAQIAGAGSEAARPLVLPALGLAVFAGLGCLPWPARRAGNMEWELLLRPIWLFPLLRSLESGPWPIAWALLVPLIGAAAMLWAAMEALRARNSRRGMERLLAVVLGMALICAGLNTAPGVAGALWALLAHALLLLWMPGDNGRAVLPACFLMLFVAGWWTAGAAAAAGAFLVAGAAWLAGMVAGIAAVLWPDRAVTREGYLARRHPPFRHRARRGGAVVAMVGLSLVLLALFAPLATEFLVVPVVDQLGAGLTPFGLLDVWPWIGVAALNAGHRRVALLPTVALAPLLLTVMSAVWLLLRLAARPTRSLTRQPPLAGVSEGPRVLPSPLVPLITGLRKRIWWLRTARNG